MRALPLSASRGAGRRTAVIVILGTFTLQALTMLTGIMIARLLGVDGRGMVAFVMAVGQLVMMLTWGSSLPIAVTRQIAARGVTARDALRPLSRRRSWWLVPPALLGGVAVTATIARSGPGQLTVLMVVVFAIIVQMTLSRLQLACLQGEVGRLERMMAIALVPQATLAAALVGIWISDITIGPIGVLTVSALSMSVGLAAGWFALERPHGSPDDALDETALWAETRSAFVSSVRPLDSIGLDRILVGTLVGQAALGLYASAIAIANLCGIVGNAVAVITLPRVAQAHGSVRTQRAIARRWAGFTAVVGLVVLVVLQLVVDPVIRFAFGEPFSGAIETARWLIVADVLLGIRKVLIAVLQGQGRGRIASWIEFCCVPPMVAGIAAAAACGWLPGIGMTMVVVASVAVTGLGWAVWRTEPANSSF